MHNYARFLSFVVFLTIPFSLLGEGGYIGENPGFDFYSKIDEGNYTILEKSVTRRLKETPKFDDFGKNCIGISILAGMPLDEATLKELTNLDYTSFSKKVNEKIKSDPSLKISTDKFQALAVCLASNYQTLQGQARRESNARETISYLGLYMDGDKNNSEYDIVTDIEKINGLIFSEDLKYTGTANNSAKGLRDFLSNKALTPLLPPDILGTISNSGSPIGTGGTIASGGTTPITPTTSGGATPPDLATLLGTTCSLSGATTGPIDTVFDETFATELAVALASGGGPTSSINGGGYTPPVGGTTSTASGGGSSSTPMTSAGDFFHNMPCTSIFCIKTKMIPGGGGSLGGGKNVSIEGILEKHSKILYPISESALGCQVMTNNTASSPKKGLKLVNTLAGLKVYLAEKPQVTRRDKREATPDRETEELKDIVNCGYAAAGLSTDEGKSRTIGGAGFMGTKGSTSDDQTSRTTPLGAQESAELARYAGCIETHMAGGRKTYYDSFSVDLGELQTYTATMMKEINNIMVILTEMNYKKTQCDNS